MNKLFFSLLITGVSCASLAKLPVPVLDDAAKAKASEAAAKTVWSGKFEGFLLCKSMDKTAAHFQKTAAAAGKTSGPAVTTPPCADPGAFVYPPLAAPPVAAPAVAAAPAATAPSTAPAAAAPAKKS